VYLFKGWLTVLRDHYSYGSTRVTKYDHVRVNAADQQVSC